MDIFTLLLGIAVVAAITVMVGAPLVRRNSDGDVVKDGEVTMEENLEKRKEDVFAILNEIEFDYKTQKLAEEDYQLLKNKYQRQAVALLKAEDEMLGSKLSSNERNKLEEEVEDEIPGNWPNYWYSKREQINWF